MVPDDPSSDPADFRNERMMQEVFDIIDMMPTTWVNAESMVLNHSDTLDPIADYSVHPTLRKSVLSALHNLEDEGKVERREEWGGRFFRIE